VADATPNFVPRKEGRLVVKAEWGLKRTCQSCGARFYDLGKAEIVCPKCGAVFDPEASVKARRPKAVAAERAPAPEPVAEEEEVEVAGADEEAATEDAEDEAVMEDTSELGEDEEDVAEVIENVDEEDER
jgi:uncharacterized protein (TIGR02300 family)